MKVKELIKELRKHNADYEVSCFTARRADEMEPDEQGWVGLYFDIKTVKEDTERDGAVELSDV